MSITPASFWDRLRGKDTPSGTVDDAWRLIRAGDVSSARELLRRICKHEPRNFEAHVLYAFDLQRPQVDSGESDFLMKSMEREFPETFESFAFLALTFGVGMSIPGLVRALDMLDIAKEKTPRTSHGAAVLLCARLILSDLVIQGDARPVGTKIDSYCTNLALKGVAKYMLREHGEALAIFEQGERTATTNGVAIYEKFFEVPLDDQQRFRIASHLTGLCLIGQGLVLRELNRATEAKERFARVWREFGQDHRLLRPLLEEKS